MSIHKSRHFSTFHLSFSLSLSHLFFSLFIYKTAADVVTIELAAVAAEVAVAKEADRTGVPVCSHSVMVL